jgi:hypothetical protein
VTYNDVMSEIFSTPQCEGIISQQDQIYLTDYDQARDATGAQRSEDVAYTFDVLFEADGYCLTPSIPFYFTSNKALLNKCPNRLSRVSCLHCCASKCYASLYLRTYALTPVLAQHSSIKNRRRFDPTKVKAILTPLIA